MAYLDQRFPVRVAAGAQGGPGFSTSVVTLGSGAEARNQNWSRSRHSYDVSHGVKNSADFDSVGAHFRMARGRANHFRFKDWADFSCLQADSTLTQITTTTFQATKRYGAVTALRESRKLTRLVSGTVIVYNTGSPVTQAAGPGNCLVDLETGIVTFGTAPGAVTLQIACQFDVPCRYDADQMTATLVHRNANGTSLMGWESVPLVEVYE